MIDEMKEYAGIFDTSKLDEQCKTEDYWRICVHGMEDMEIDKK